VSFPSPSGAYQLDIDQPRLVDAANLRVDLVDHNGTSRTLDEVGHEMYMQFAFPYWSPDEKIVAIVACGTDDFRLAYDIPNQQLIPLEEIADPRRDPLASACDIGEWVLESALSARTDWK
jgi:hypothetical protein